MLEKVADPHGLQRITGDWIGRQFDGNVTKLLLDRCSSVLQILLLTKNREKKQALTPQPRQLRTCSIVKVKLASIDDGMLAPSALF